MAHSVSFTYDLIHIMDFWYLILLPVTLSINPSFLYSNVVKLQDTDNHSFYGKLLSVTAGLGQPVILFPRCYVVSLHDVERNIKRKIIMESSNKISNVKSGTK